MSEMNLLAVAVASVAAFVLSSVWYAVFGSRLARLSPAHAGPTRPIAALLPVEFGRNAVVATVTAGLATRAGVDSVAGAVGLGAVLWIAFPVVILAGSVFHERVPLQLAVIHAGDWLLKLLAIAVIVAVWPVVTAL